MKVTAEIKKLFNEGKIKAAAAVTIGDIFVIRNVRLVEGANGLFISMPSHKNSRGEYKSVCFPITNDFRLRIFDEVMEAYETVTVDRAAADGSQTA